MEDLINKIKDVIELESGKIYWIRIKDSDQKELDCVADQLVTTQENFGCKFVVSDDRCSIEDITKEFKNNI